MMTSFVTNVWTKFDSNFLSHEGTKVQNPLRLCHVHCIIANIQVYTCMYTEILICICGQSVRASIRKYLAKTKALRSSSSLLPTLRGILGTA